MRAYITPPDNNSRSLTRISEALEAHAPDWVEIVPSMPEADLVVLHVIGRQDKTQAIVEYLKGGGKQFAIIQYCVRSTLRPHTDGWLPLWESAKTVWSYLDLWGLCREDGTHSNFGLYLTPLGVSETFHKTGNSRPYIIATSGQSYLTESVKEAHLAAIKAGRDMFHLGPKINRKGILCASDIPDDMLAQLYNQCEFVSGLRRIEGFEMPAAEGLLCGARPILFDKPHYRMWYDDMADYIYETPREGVVDSLERLFQNGARPVTDEELEMARNRFDWGRIVKGFWERCL
jgi:hypothetical protein